MTLPPWVDVEAIAKARRAMGRDRDRRERDAVANRILVGDPHAGSPERAIAMLVNAETGKAIDRDYRRGGFRTTVAPARRVGVTSRRSYR